MMLLPNLLERCTVMGLGKAEHLILVFDHRPVPFGYDPRQSEE